MNILQVISSTRTSGAEKHMVVLSEALRQRGHSILAVCPPGGWLTERLQAASILSIELPMHGMKAPQAIAKIRRLARQNDIDLIHTHLTRATYMGYFAGFLAHVPVISTVHVMTRDFAYRRLPHGNHWFVAVSNYLRQALIEKGVPSSRVMTVYNGTDMHAVDELVPTDSLSVRAELGLPADAELVGQFGRVDVFKGAPILVRSIKSVVNSVPRAHFVFVGHAEPGIQQALWELARVDGVEERLRFTGLRDDIPRLMEAMDVVTLPSLTEACSMAIIEAMTMGRPVVATRAGGNPELVLDTKTGLLVERSPEPLAEALASLLKDPEKRLEMGKAAQCRAEEMFTARSMAENMESLYDRILAGAVV